MCSIAKRLLLILIAGVLMVQASNAQAHAAATDPAANIESPIPYVEPAAPSVLLSINGVADENTSKVSFEGLSSNCISLLKSWGLLDEVEQLADAHVRWKSTRQIQDTVDYLLAKQQFTEELAAVGFDVRRCTNAIDREIARNQEKTAHLTELRDKAIRFNTYANFIAGGMTGIISGALEVADLSRFSFNTVDILEGAGQAGLSLWAFKAEHSGDRKPGPMPNILTVLIDEAQEHATYPPTVRAYLNTVPEGSTDGKTHAEVLVARWQHLQFCLAHKGHRRQRERIKKITGNHEEDATLTIDLLEDRIAMLQDLRSEITTMDEHLGELLDWIRKH